MNLIFSAETTGTPPETPYLTSGELWEREQGQIDWKDWKATDRNKSRNGNLLYLFNFILARNTHSHWGNIADRTCEILILESDTACPKSCPALSRAVQVDLLTKQRTTNQGGACPRVSKSGKVWENSRKSAFSDFDSDAFNHSAILPVDHFVGFID